MHVRNQLGLLPHTEVKFEVAGDHAHIRKLEGLGGAGGRGIRALEALRGTADARMSTDEILVPNAREKPYRQTPKVRPSLPGLLERLRDRRGVLVDSNVLLDVATNDPEWSDWSGSVLAECTEMITLILNPITYAELSTGYSAIEALNNVLPAVFANARRFRRRRVFWPAKPFWRTSSAVEPAVRRSQIPTSAPHAAIERLALLTRDVARYRTYFPTLEILSPRKGRG